MLLCKNSRLFTLQVGILFIFLPTKYTSPIPIKLFPFPFSISSPKLLPLPWEFYGNPMGMAIPIPVHTSTLYVANLHCRWIPVTSVKDVFRANSLMKFYSVVASSCILWSYASVQWSELASQFVMALMHTIGSIMVFGLGIVYIWMQVALSFITLRRLSSLLVCWLRVIFALITTAMFPLVYVIYWFVTGEFPFDNGIYSLMQRVDKPQQQFCSACS